MCESTTRASAAQSLPPSSGQARRLPGDHRPKPQRLLQMAQACGRVMRPGSNIVNVSSVVGIVSTGLPQAAYSGAGRSAWAAVRPDGPMDPMEGDPHECPRGRVLPKRHDVAARAMPIGRPGDPAEPAAALVFLASDAASRQTLAAKPGSSTAVRRSPRARFPPERHRGRRAPTDVARARRPRAPTPRRRAAAQRGVRPALGARSPTRRFRALFGPVL